MDPEYVYVPCGFQGLQFEKHWGGDGFHLTVDWLMDKVGLPVIFVFMFEVLPNVLLDSNKKKKIWWT